MHDFDGRTQQEDADDVPKKRVRRDTSQQSFDYLFQRTIRDLRVLQHRVDLLAQWRHLHRQLDYVSCKLSELQADELIDQDQLSTNSGLDQVTDFVRSFDSFDELTEANPPSTSPTPVDIPLNSSPDLRSNSFASNKLMRQHAASLIIDQSTTAPASSFENTESVTVSPPVASLPNSDTVQPLPPIPNTARNEINDQIEQICRTFLNEINQVTRFNPMAMPPNVSNSSTFDLNHTESSKEIRSNFDFTSSTIDSIDFKRYTTSIASLLSKTIRFDSSDTPPIVGTSELVSSSPATDPDTVESIMNWNVTENQAQTSTLFPASSITQAPAFDSKPDAEPDRSDRDDAGAPPDPVHLWFGRRKLIVSSQVKVEDEPTSDQASDEDDEEQEDAQDSPRTNLSLSAPLHAGMWPNAWHMTHDTVFFLIVANNKPKSIFNVFLTCFALSLSIAGLWLVHFLVARLGLIETFA